MALVIVINESCWLDFSRSTVFDKMCHYRNKHFSSHPIVSASKPENAFFLGKPIANDKVFPDSLTIQHLVTKVPRSPLVDSLTCLLLLLAKTFLGFCTVVVAVSSKL